MNVSKVGLSQIQNSVSVQNSLSQKAAKSSVTNTIKTAAAVTSAVTASAVAASNLPALQNNSAQQRALRMRNHEIDGKKVFDKNATVALKYIKQFAPNTFKQVILNPENIKSCTYIPETDVEKAICTIKTVDNSYSFNLKLFNTAKTPIFSEMEQVFTAKDGSSKTIKHSRINGTTKIKTETTVKDKDGEVKTELYPITADKLGILHKKTIVRKTSFDKKNVETVATELDGSKTIRKSKKNDKGKVTDTLLKKYSSNGVIEYESTYHTDYETKINPKTNKEEDFATKHIINKDYKNNTTSDVVLKDKKTLEKEVRKITNPMTGKTRTEVLEKSDVEGILNSTITDENGNKKIESLGVKNPDGSTHVEKHFVSLDGTKTEYEYNASKDKDDIKMFYQITDKDGNVLSTVDRVYKRISPERSYSSLNGHGYTMTKVNDGLEITDLVSNKTSVIKYDEIIKANGKEEEAKKFLDKMSADMILNLKERKIKLVMIENVMESKMEGTRDLDCGDNIFVFSHESGHSKDRLPKFRGVTNNPNFRKTYEMEKSAFLKAFPDVQQDYISYFINGIESCGGIDRAPAEVVAETNAFFSTDFTVDRLSSRAHYLQKYFPRTIAQGAKLLNPNSNLYVK